MAGGLAAPVPLAPGAQPVVTIEHSAAICATFLEGVETVPVPMAAIPVCGMRVRNCLNEVAKSGTQMHRYTVLEAEAHTAVFRAPARDRAPSIPEPGARAVDPGTGARAPGHRPSTLLGA